MQKRAAARGGEKRANVRNVVFRRFAEPPTRLLSCLRIRPEPPSLPSLLRFGSVRVAKETTPYFFFNESFSPQKPPRNKRFRSKPTGASLFAVQHFLAVKPEEHTFVHLLPTLRPSLTVASERINHGSYGRDARTSAFFDDAARVTFVTPTRGFFYSFYDGDTRD